MFVIFWAAAALFIWAICANASRNDNPLNLPE